MVFYHNNKEETKARDICAADMRENDSEEIAREDEKERKTDIHLHSLSTQCHLCLQVAPDFMFQTW